VAPIAASPSPNQYGLGTDIEQDAPIDGTGAICSLPTGSRPALSRSTLTVLHGKQSKIDA
jgi:hypothetical protein